MKTTALTPVEIQRLAQAQRVRREEAQARIAEAQKAKEAAEADTRRAMLIEYHLYRAAALADERARPDRFEESYLRWQVGLAAEQLTLDPLMFDTEKVYRLLRFLSAKRQLGDALIDAQYVRMEFPNWIDDLALIPTDGSIRSALKSLAVRPTGIRETDAGAGTFRYDPAADKCPRFRRKTAEDAK